MAKRKEVVDLTSDGDEPSPKRIRCSTTQQVEASAKQKFALGSVNISNFDDEDELLAKELQAQYDQESSGHAHNCSPPTEDNHPYQHILLIREYVESVLKNSCVACGKRFLSEEKDVLLIFKQWLSDTEKRGNAFKQFISGGFLQGGFGEINSVINCPRMLCFCATCIGCGTRCSTKVNSAEAEGVRELTWCCDRGRLFLIWTLLCGYDRRQTNLGLRATSSSSTAKSQASGKSTNGIGYGGNYVKRPWKSYSVKTQTDPEDATTERIITCLTALLPSLTGENPTTFDLEPPTVLQSIIIHSKLLGKAAELLRNDSLEDATQRLALYQSTLRFVEKLGSHPCTANTTIYSERPEAEQELDLLKLSFTACSAASEDHKPHETNQSIAACLASFDRQSKLILERSKVDPDNFAAEDSTHMLSLCRGVSDLSDFLLANSGRSQTANTTNESDTIAVKDSWHKALAMLELPDDDLTNTFCFADDASKIAKPPLGRMKALSLEIARLSTGLPAGIFVRHCSSRLDVMKILIIGPRGTPYENGLFEFDLLCGKDFPKEPPKMQFKTTGGGTIRFNPNLYADGKVCLSLLGTWSGEPWQPGSSTILQVLLSIQAMIFCEEPWCNEPGREDRSGSRPSMDYNRTVQGWTVKYAMADWLKADDDGVWGDIVGQHFRTSASEILAKVEEWSISNDWKGQLRDGLKTIGVV